MVVFYWFSVMTLADGGTTMDRNTAVFVFVCAILITFFSVDLLKIAGAKKLRPILNAKRLKFLNRFIGMVFMVFGVALVVRGILGY